MIALLKVFLRSILSLSTRKTSVVPLNQREIYVMSF